MFPKYPLSITKLTLKGAGKNDNRNDSVEFVRTHLPSGYATRNWFCSNIFIFPPEIAMFQFYFIFVI